MPDNNPQATEQTPGVATSDTAAPAPETYTEEPIEREDGTFTTRSELERADADAAEQGKKGKEAPKKQGDDATAEGGEQEAKDDGEDDDGKQEPDADTKRRRSAERRIAKATRKQRQAEREREEARAEAARLRAEVENLRSTSATAKPGTEGKAAGGEEPPKRPRLDDFDDLDDYEKAMESYVEQRSAHEQRRHRPETPSGDDASQQREQSQSQQQDIAQTLTPEQQDAIHDMMSDGRASFGDFDDVVLRGSNTDAIGPGTFMAALDADNAAGLVYHLASHPETAAELRALESDPAALARALGRIEAHLEANTSPGDAGSAASADGAGAREGSVETDADAPAPSQESAPAAAPTAPRRRVTSAPDPIAPVAGSGRGNAATRVDPSKLSPSEFRRWRASGGGT